MAYYLSQVCTAVMDVLRERASTRGDLAVLVDEDPRNLRRKLNGEYPAKHEDILRWALALGRPDIILAPGDSSDLAPQHHLGAVRRQLGMEGGP